LLKLSISCVRISFNLFSPPIIASFALSNTRSWYQNAAARLVSGARRHDHITTPILATLHRLPVRQRVIFKTALLLYTTQRHVIWPTSVPTASTDCRCHSRSAVSGALLVPWTRTSTGQRSFAVYGPRTWNRLPAALRSPELSLSSFKRQLKTHSSVPALDSAGCSCGCRVPSSTSGAVVTVQRVRRRLQMSRLDSTHSELVESGIKCMHKRWLGFLGCHHRIC